MMLDNNVYYCLTKWNSNIVKNRLNLIFICKKNAEILTAQGRHSVWCTRCIFFVISCFSSVWEVSPTLRENRQTTSSHFLALKNLYSCIKLIFLYRMSLDLSKESKKWYITFFCTEVRYLLWKYNLLPHYVPICNIQFVVYSNK